MGQRANFQCWIWSHILERGCLRFIDYWSKTTSRLMKGCWKIYDNKRRCGRKLIPTLTIPQNLLHILLSWFSHHLDIKPHHTSQNTPPITLSWNALLPSQFPKIPISITLSQNIPLPSHLHQISLSQIHIRGPSSMRVLEPSF